MVARILYMRLFSIIIDQFEMMVRAAKLLFWPLTPTHDNFSIFATSVALVFALSIITASKTSLWSKLQSILTMQGM